MNERTTLLVIAGALAVCLVAGSPARVVGDGGEYLAQALNFAGLGGPSLGRQAIPTIERRIHGLEPALSGWSIERASVAGHDGRRDFLHFWFYALLTTPFVWLTRIVGISPLHAFTALNLTMLMLALRLALPHIGLPALVLLFASPLVWWIDKAHTEVFTVALLTITMVTVRDRPWWALVAAGAASTQNPPIAILVVLILGVETVRRRAAVLTDRRLLAAGAAALVLAALQPVYTWVRHGTPSLLLHATRDGMPGWTELSASVVDPSMGLSGNFPLFLLATGAVLLWMTLRHRRLLVERDVLVAAAASVVFLYSFAQTSNPHHGATPSLTRYALWLIPMTLPIWAAARTRLQGRRLLWTTATTSALISVFAFHPTVPQYSREPTWLATWLWTRHPTLNDPLPEVFSETILQVEGTTVPVSTAGCEKVLLAGAPGAGVWPIPCLPAPLPPHCRPADVLCYANRRGDSYQFSRTPGRAPHVRRNADMTWPIEAELHVRRIYQDAGWAAMVDSGSADLESLRAWERVRVAAFGSDERLLLVLRPTGDDAFLRFRPAHAVEGKLIDPLSGATIQELRFDGPLLALWDVPLPAAPGSLLILALRQKDSTE